MTDFYDFDPDGDDVVSREVIEHAEPATDRSTARRIALQALYEIDTAKHRIGDVLANNIEYSPDQRTIRNYISHLVQGVIANNTALDEVLQKYAPDWPIDQVAVIDRNILRIALFELGIESRTPVSVAIDEAVVLAKLFGAENTPRFVNGVLGTIADNLDIVRETLATKTSDTKQEESTNDIPEASE